jgi:hypothetical protein
MPARATGARVRSALALLDDVIDLRRIENGEVEAFARIDLALHLHGGAEEDFYLVATRAFKLRYEFFNGGAHTDGGDEFHVGGLCFGV